MSISAMKQALEALALFASDESDDGQMAISAYEALRQAIEQAEKQEPVRMRMPKVGDRIICLEDETLGTVKYLTAGGSPEIKFDDGSYGTYLLREFAELFSYAAPIHASDISQERVDETVKDRHKPVAWLDGGLGVFYWACEFKDRPVPPGFEPLYAAYPRYWSNVTDDALIEEVRRRGFTIRDAQISPKREWVELTDEEVGGLTVFDNLTHIEVPILADFVRAVEAKLKEKNT